MTLYIDTVSLEQRETWRLAIESHLRDAERNVRDLRMCLTESAESVCYASPQNLLQSARYLCETFSALHILDQLLLKDKLLKVQKGD